MSAKNIQVCIHGQKYTLYQLSQKYNINWTTVRQRYYNYQVGENLIRPANKLRFTIHKKHFTLKQLAQYYQIKAATIYSRYRAGKRGEELIQPPQVAIRPLKKRVILKADVSHVHFENGLWDFRSLGQAYGLTTAVISSRYYRGDRNDDLVRPLGKKIRASRHLRHVNVNGKRMTFKELSKRYGLSLAAIYSRYYQGKRGKELIRPILKDNKA